LTIKQDDILILASDGLWDVMSNNEVAYFVHNLENYWDPQQICSKLYKEISNRCKLMERKEDNVTLVIVPFTMLPSKQTYINAH